MSTNVFSLHCSPLATAVLVGFKGREILNRPFEFEVFFTVPEGTDVRGAIGSEATLTANREAGGTALSWHGVFVSMRLLHQTRERGLYHALLVPKLWLLRQHVRSHVQTKKGQKVKDFTAATLKDGGLADGADFAFKLNASYPEEEFVCQYHESHLDFVHRWFEREGLYYYFEHQNATSGAPKMMVVDEHSSSKALIGDGHVRYVPQADGDHAQGDDCFNELHFDLLLLPASVAIVDHNYANPAAPVNGKQLVVKGGQGVLHESGYRVFDSGQAERLAQVRAQSIGCRELTLQAKGTYLGLRPGYDFELEEGPSEYPTKYQPIEVRHTATLSAHSPEVQRYTGLRGGRTYEVEVFAIPSDVPYRAPQTAAWPRIYGFEHGTVDGKATSPYAQIDDQGRYLVRFHFDTADLADGSTSTFLRMMQPHGGNPEGFHFPLRKGTEVMLAFLGGDPDRPMIASVAPDAHRPSLVTNRNHTQNVIRTGGKNHMVIEDQDGQQSIDLYTPQMETNFYLGHPRKHAFSTPPEEKSAMSATITAVECSAYLYTGGSAGFVVDGDWWQNVGVDYFVTVGGKSTIEYNGNYVLNVNSPTKKFYNSTLETEIKSGWKDTIASGGVVQKIEGGGWKQEVTGDSEQKIKGNMESVSSGEWALKAKGGWKVEETPGVEWNIGGKGVEIKTGKEFKITAPKIELHATDFFHFEPHKEEFIGHLFEAVGLEEIVAATAQIHAAPLLVHLTGYTAHTGGSHMHTQLHHLETKVTGMKTEATAIATRATKLETEVSCIHKFAIAMMG